MGVVSSPPDSCESASFVEMIPTRAATLAPLNYCVVLSWITSTTFDTTRNPPIPTTDRMQPEDKGGRQL
ncbi:hypothetical protein TNCV_4021181 [Trichonephila clavipes]|nr:hypothetical protein TNCV_4021181 [Trichonephila clavipes]